MPQVMIIKRPRRNKLYAVWYERTPDGKRHQIATACRELASATVVLARFLREHGQELDTAWPCNWPCRRRKRQPDLLATA